MQSRIKQAVLHVHVQDHDQPSALSGNTSRLLNDDTITAVTVQVTRVWRPPNSRWESALAATATAGLTGAQRRRGATLRVDVTDAIVDWIRLPRSELGFVVRAHDASKKRHQIPVTLDSIDHSPYLELYIDDDHRRRTKRTIGLTCNEEDSEETRCCRYPLTVDFEDFGWDWIIAPKKYEANFCMGDCPYAFMQKFPNTHVVHLASPPGYPGPCCTPRKMSPIRLLHFDHDLNIIVGDIPGMIVEKCGCS